MGNRKNKTFAELFQPLSAKRPRAGGSAQDNPALHEIWHAVSAIPRGKASTYGAVARAAGLPGRARQVGFALRVAPEEMHLPWHRVVGAGGKIVFSASSRERREQARRLRSEGVKVIRGRVAPSAMVELEYS
jgi:methylated-DNA-protein-cysteine methyltransferase-like protein